MPRRNRDYRAEFKNRVERGRKYGVSSRAAAGHGRGDELRLSDVETRWVLPTAGGIGEEVQTRGDRQASRAGEYGRDLRRLFEGEIDDEDFDEKWGNKQIGWNDEGGRVRASSASDARAAIEADPDLADPRYQRIR